jgi:TPR repeat protein
MKRLTLTALLTCTGCGLVPAGLYTPDSPQTASSGNEAAQCAEARGRSSPTALGATTTAPPGNLDALFWCTKAAEKGDAKSQFVLAGLHERGIGTPANQPEAIRWYKTAARNGYAEAQFKVGLLYGRGEGVPQDKNEATRWYKKAADQGHPEAQFYMGYRYEYGKGISQNYGEALRWYGKAAEQGNVSALNGLGSLYLAGHGVPQNQVEAYKWFNLAAASGEREYLANRDRVAGKLSPAQLAEGQRLASEWAKTHSIRKKATY